jgi:hypothetical protein
VPGSGASSVKTLLFVALTLAVPPGHATAPVYTYVSEGVLQRTGTFIYKQPAMGYEVLYCIAEPPKVSMTCVVHTPSDALVLIDAQVSEQKT